MTLLLHCHRVTTPDLKAWHSGKYSEMLYDEADWRLLSQNKVLFQSSTKSVTMSQSQCIKEALDVWVYGCPMMICSNDFWAGCQDDELRQWIDATSYHEKVTQEMWNDPDKPHSQPSATLGVSEPPGTRQQ